MTRHDNSQTPWAFATPPLQAPEGMLFGDVSAPPAAGWLLGDEAVAARTLRRCRRRFL